MTTISLLLTTWMTIVFSISSLSLASALDTDRQESIHQSSTSYNDANCTNVRIPPQLCIRCKLRPHDLRGNFGRAYKKDIIDIDDARCVEQLNEYVRLNSCDVRRAEYVSKMNEKTFAYRRVAQFLYTICEQCCDMVSVGSVRTEWAARKQSGRLHSVTRGNGPSHIHYDVCKLFPNVTRFIRPQWAHRDGLSPICPIAAQWMASPNSKNWASNPDAQNIPKRLTFALAQMETVFSCKHKRVWQDCVQLESAQGRI